MHRIKRLTRRESLALLTAQLCTVLILCLPALAAEGAKPSFDPLIGRWQRTDGGYVLEVVSVADDGAAQVRYFNPRPINVASAKASPGDGGVKLFVKLQDVGYPGSTYTLMYSPQKDALLGVYYQAAAGQYFSVAFVRVR